MNSYADTQVIECARLHSEEAKSNNNENFALWTNNLTDIVHLAAGDVVSMQGAMISERGAGQSTSIEIKGIDLGPQKTFEFINLSGVEEDSSCPSGFKRIDANLSTKQVNIRDDTAVFTISYYISANGENYIQLPRNFWWNGSLNPPSDNWVNSDTIATHGRSWFDPFNSSSGDTTSRRYTLRKEYYQQSYEQHTALKNNGDRYTLMVRDTTFFKSDASNLSDDIPVKYMRDPENAIYRTYKELKEITLEKGFNSPEYIADDITRQLQKVSENNTFEIRTAKDITDNGHLPGFPVPIHRTYETETYKAFDVAGIQDENMSANFDAWLSQTNNASMTQGGVDYISNYQYVACKRPELYETGRLINMEWTSPQNVYTGIRGCEMRKNWGAVGSNVDANRIHLKVRYDKDSCDKFKAFFDAQDIYPEIWDMFNDPENRYGAENQNESRWIHINQQNNTRITDGTTDQAQLGWSGYYNPSDRETPPTATTQEQFSSFVLPITYDESQKDTFYNAPNQGKGERTYGCIGESDGFMVLFPTRTNGYNSIAWTQLSAQSDPDNDLVVPAGQRIGFDMHFSAPGLGWLLPFSGITPKPQEFQGNALDLVNQSTARNSNASVMKDYSLEPYKYRSKLYIGADAPRLQWDGTHFGFSDLHTAMNRGNDFRAQTPYGGGADIGNAQSLTPDADDVVYKINPKEQFTDWTPVRMPYVSNFLSYLNASNNVSESYVAEGMNENLEPWIIYDSLCGIFITDFNLSESEWEGTIFDRLGFSYKQFHNPKSTRLSRIDYNNANDLSLITTNSEVNEGDTKIYYQNMFKAPMFKNQLPLSQILNNVSTDASVNNNFVWYPEIVQKTESIIIKADNLPTRMIRGYYAIRTNILQEPHFVGGKVDNTELPIIAICDKINGDGDFYFQAESNLQFTITKPLRLASITCSIHDPDGSYANTSEQNTVLFKITRQKNVTFNVVEELLQEQQPNQQKPN